MEDILSAAYSILQTTPVHWLNLVATIPIDLLSRRPAPGEWSALECLQHLVEAERRAFPTRVEAVLAGREIPRFDPDRQGLKPETATLSAGDLAAEFTVLRQQSLVTFSKVTPADLPRQSHHQELGTVSLSELIHEWAAHDLMHTVQAERALMQPFILGCGPWIPYFRDHLVDSQEAS